MMAWLRQHCQRFGRLCLIGQEVLIHCTRLIKDKETYSFFSRYVYFLLWRFCAFSIFKV